MKNKLLALALFICTGSFAQQTLQWGGTLSRDMLPDADTVFLDSFYVRPASVLFFTTDSNQINPSYTLQNDTLALLIFNPPLRDTLQVQYKTLGINLSQKVYNKPRTLLLPPEVKPTQNQLYQSSDNSAFSPFSGLDSKGSISRSVSVGNNQDAVLNSSLNLQLSGNLGKQTEIRASITDNNIPVQSDGYTQQLREFDRVYIELENPDFGLIRAGDYNMQNQSYLLNFDKRISGASVFTDIEFGDSNLIPLRVEGGLARGRFARNRFQGQEGNQGPYKLVGNNNEQFIIIISGSERVYIDGNLLIRGQQNDYVIDYNAGEITFTALRPITKESRVVVEFQYTEQNYLRSVAFGATGFSNKKVQTQIQFYSEQDSKNQPLTTALSDDDKRLLSNSGDDLQSATVSTIRQSTFLDDQVFYELRDSLGFDSILVYSVDSTQTLYQASFTFVGQGLGDYIITQNSANGRVFQWLAPISGIPQGNYAPIRQLAAPNLLQILNSKTVYKINENNRLEVDLATSRNDINLFSDAGKANDQGFAGRVNYNGQKQLKKGKLFTNLGVEFNDNNFTTIERVRNVEFARDWNLPLNYNSGIQLANTELGYQLDTSAVSYRLQFLNIDGYQGFRQEVNGRLKSPKTFGVARASWLSANDSLGNSNFLREKARLGYYYAPKLWVGIFSEGEWNSRNLSNTDTLTSASYRFLDVGAFTGVGDTAKNFAEVFYNQRFDDTARFGQYANFSQVQATGIRAQAKTNFNSTLSARVFNRSLKVFEPIERELERTITARVNYVQRFFKNSITSTTFYEAGSGTEARRIFNYVEVPVGTGVYTHTDYNGNGIKELDEFEVAPTPDRAQFVRVFLPTNEYIRTNLNKFSEIVNLNAPFTWQNGNTVQKIASRFSILSNYQLDRKTLLTGNTNRLNPFAEVVDDSVIVALNNSFRNTLYFNRTKTKFGMDYTYRTADNRNLLSFGVEQRTVLENTVNLRWQLIDPLQFRIGLSNIEKQNSSDNFVSRNFSITQIINSYSLAYQPSDKLIFTGSFAFDNQTGMADTDISLNATDAGLNLTYNLANSISLQTQINYIVNRFEGSSNNPAAFEMLKGLQPGQNGTWNVILQKTIRKNILLSLNYSGRISEENPVIQIANVQVKAFF